MDFSSIICGLHRPSCAMHKCGNIIENNVSRPVERLEAILRIVKPLDNIPQVSEFDCLHRHIITSAYNVKGVLRILGALLYSQKLYSPKGALDKFELSIPVTDTHFLEILLLLNYGDIPLFNAILSFPDGRCNTISQPPNTMISGQCLRMPLISDFLTDRSPTGRHFINSVEVYAAVARCCVQNIFSGRSPHCDHKIFELTH